MENIDTTKQEIQALKIIIFNLESLLKKELPRRIVGDGNRREPTEEFKTIMEQVDFLRTTERYH